MPFEERSHSILPVNSVGPHGRCQITIAVKFLAEGGCIVCHSLLEIGLQLTYCYLGNCVYTRGMQLLVGGDGGAIIFDYLMM